MDFDQFADTYEQEIAAATRFAGVSPKFFLEAKLTHILETLRKRYQDLTKLRVLDMGCGIGLVDQALKVHVPNLAGADISEKSLLAARARNPEIEYALLVDGLLPFADRSFEVVVSICVWHHVPPHQWSNFLSEIARVLTPTGILLVYEHNPLNPLTRLAVSRCAFDADAVLLSAVEAGKYLRLAGFRNVATDYLLFLPFKNRIIRFCEKTLLRRIPLGAQYALCGTW
jgi:SAM-dependent methyltransferase